MCQIIQVTRVDNNPYTKNKFDFKLPMPRITLSTKK